MNLEETGVVERKEKEEERKVILLSLHFIASKCDPSLFMLHRPTQCTLMPVYVDDIIITDISQVFIQ